MRVSAMDFAASFSVASMRNVLLVRHDDGEIRATMAELRQSSRQVTTERLRQDPASSGWDRFDLVCGIYLLLLLIAFSLTGIALARGDLPSEKIPQQITDN